MRLPKYIARYFWDIDTKKATPKSHQQYFISRILDKGNGEAVSWLFKLFGKTGIKSRVRTSRLSPRSANYWHKYFRLS